MKLLIMLMVIISCNVLAQPITRYKMSNSIGPIQNLNRVDVEKDAGKVKVSFISDSYKEYMVFDDVLSSNTAFNTLDYIRRYSSKDIDIDIKIGGITSAGNTYMYSYIENGTMSICTVYRAKCVLMSRIHAREFIKSIQDKISKL